MATLNLGRIKPVFRGAYAGGTAYVVDDIVTSGNETFICILASTGNATSNATYWTKLAAKGTDGTDVGTTITTQGDVLYRDGSGLARLAARTSGHVLTTGGAGANPSWAAASGGKVLQVIGALDTTARTLNSQTFSTFGNTMGITITPSATTSKILLMYEFAFWTGTNNVRTTIYRDINSAGATNLAADGMKADGGNSHHPYSSLMFLDSPNTTSSIVYEIMFRGSGSNALINRGYSSSYEGIGQAVAMEIGA